jgi:hypothetical protein
MTRVTHSHLPPCYTKAAGDRMWITLPLKTIEENARPPFLLLLNLGAPEKQKSGQFICYKTGQFYLLLTGVISV